MVLAPLLGVVLPLAAFYFRGPVVMQAVLFVIGWVVVGTFPLFMATIPSETIDSRYTATALGLIMGLGEAIVGVVAPTLAGVASDHFGLEAAVWIMAGLPLLAAAVALGLIETAPRLRRNGALASAA